MHKLHLANAATILAAFAAAAGCGAAARDGSRRPESAAAAERPDRVAPKVSGTVTPRGVVSAAALAVCDTVAGRWQAASGTQVTRAESSFYAFAAGDTVLGCHVSMAAPAGVSAAAWHASYWSDSLSMGSVGRGWIDEIHWDGDGPGTLSRVLMRNGVRCHVINESDAGSDDDSTYVPSPRETQVTSCWLGPAMLTPRDTGGT